MTRFRGPFMRTIEREGPPGARGHAHDEKLRLLRTADLFRGLTDADMERVGQMTMMSQCVRGQTIYAPGETREALFLLKRGRVQIYRLSADGKKLILSSIEPGTVFGDMVLTGQRMFDGYAEAAEDSMLCVMSRHDVEALILEYPTVGVQLVQMLSARVRELEDRLEESSLRDVPSRVAAALVRIQAQQGGAVTMTHQELADIVGAHRETVTRTLGDFRDRGFIALQRSRIAIIAPDALRALSGHTGDNATA